MKDSEIDDLKMQSASSALHSSSDVSSDMEDNNAMGEVSMKEDLEIQKNSEPNPLQINMENGKSNGQSNYNSDNLSSESNADNDNCQSYESSSSEAEEYNPDESQNRKIPKLIIKEINTPENMHISITPVSKKLPEDNGNAPLDLCVKPANSENAPVPTSIITTKNLSKSVAGPPSIKVLPIYSNNKNNSSKFKEMSKEKVIGNSGDPLTITRITPSNDGIIVTPKVKQPNISPNPVTDMERYEQKRKQEELRDQLKAELRQQQIQLKMAKQPLKRRGRPPKSQPTIVNINSKPDKPKVNHQFPPSNKPIEININTGPTTSEVHQRSIKDSSDLSSESSNNETGSSSGSELETDEADSTQSDEIGHSSKSEYENLLIQYGIHDSRRRSLADESKLRVPLNSGWRRQTRVRCFSQSGVRGEVIYFAPCGKKLRAYAEVSRYIDKHEIKNVRRENFSFSSKYNVGDFLEPSANGSLNGFKLISESDIKARLNDIKVKKDVGRRKRGRPPMQINQEKIPSKRHHSQEIEIRKLPDSAMEITRKRKRTQPNCVEIISEAQKSHELKQQQQQQKDHIKIMKMQEKIELQRQQQVQQIMEEMQKQRELMMVIDLERERQRQHMMLVKALETKKKQEEQRKIEMQVLTEMKMPAEDMEIKNQRPLPTLNRIPGVKLTSKAFGNILMVFEFLHNFGETLGFETNHLPTLNSLQLGLLNDPEYEEELISILQQLITCAIDDPGLPFYPKTLTGQSIKDVSITSLNISEVLRLYFYANCGKENEMHKWLVEYPYFALSATQKSDILAFICDEIVGSRLISRQVDMGLETVANYRKDKWIVEGELRKYRTLQAEKQHKSEFRQKVEVNGNADSLKKDGDSSSPSKTTESNANASKEDEEGPENVSGNESDDNQESENMPSTVPDDKDDGMTIEEIEKKLNKLSKQYKVVRQDFQKALYSVRANSYGQDRFRRRYWVLPRAGGVFVESVESSEPPGGDQFYFADSPVEEKIVKEEISDDKDTTKVNKAEDLSNSSRLKTEENTEQSKKPEESIKDERKSTSEVKSEGESSEGEEKKLVIDEKMEDNKTTEQQLKNSAAKLELDEKSLPKQSTKENKCSDSKGNISNVNSNSSLDKEQNLKSTKCKIECSPQSSNLNPFHANLLTNAFGLTPEQLLKVSADPNDPKPWLSLLPQVPSEDNCQNKNFNSEMPLSEASSHQQLNAFPSISTANSLQGFPAGFPNMPVMGYMNGSVLHPNMFNSAQFASPYASVFPPMMFPGMGFNAPLAGSPNAFFPGESTSTTPIPLSNISSNAANNVNEPLSESAKVAVLERLRQYDKPQLIPEELKRGWWRITDQNQVRSLIKSMHSRGVRERLLYKSLDKYMEIAVESCNLGEQEEIGLNISDEDREISEMIGGAKDMTTDLASSEIALKCAILVLEEVEAMEEKLFSASMHVKGWTIPKRLGNDESLEMVLGEDKYVSELCESEKFKGSDDDDGKDSSKDDNDGKDSSRDDDDGKDSSKDKDEAETETEKINELENATEDTSKEIQPVENSKEEESEVTVHKKKVCPILLAQEKLRNLEISVERRYLKPPLARPASNNVNSMISYSEDDITTGLQNWRNAIDKAETASQIALCLQVLIKCIAWDKSIMKASCQFCHSGDNEGMLLLCDNCDKGYHTYCFKPEMKKIPEGDWFCYECLNKGSGEKVCCLCGNKGRQMIPCDTCPKIFHLDCLEISKSPRGRWNCPCCNFRSNRTKRKPAKPRESKEPKEATEPDEQKAAKSVDKKKINKMMSTLKSIITELEKHEDSWPFLLPVDTKQFTSYKKVIKKPMDLSTIKTKVLEGQYKNKDEFVQDVTLIFDNCETFNEDDSPVGKAGHNLRSFFTPFIEDLNNSHS